MAFTTILSFLLTFAAIAQANLGTCSLDPVSLPWSNVTLADGVVANRGISIQLGGQPVALRATTLLSNCRLRNSRDCGNGNASVQSGCQGSSGSSFDIQESATWVDAPQGTWNVTTIDAPEGEETIVDGYDIAQFYGLPKIYGFPFEVWSDQQSTNKSGLSLGLNSSFINTLLANELVSSSAYGLFFGSRSQTKGVDGNLTIGGFDRARVKGPWSNFTTQAGYINYNCPLQVLVRDIRLNNARGSFSLFADSEATVIACVDPLQNQFTFTQTMYDIFANLTDHPSDPTVEGGSNFTQQTYPLSSGRLLGNLTVELIDGYTTVIPNYEFVSQERGTDAEGKYAVVNESRLMVAAGTTGTSTMDGVDIPILGGVYLSQNYLFVDFDSGVFRLAPAVLGEMDDQSHDIVQVCGGSAFDLPLSRSSGSKSNTGAIAGGVVGGAAVFTVAAVTIWCFRKRRRADSMLAMREDDRTGSDAPQAPQRSIVQPRVELETPEHSHPEIPARLL